MVKLTDDYLNNLAPFNQAGVKIPQFDQTKLIEHTKEAPVWVHFGGGNLFRCFHSVIAQHLINKGALDSGIIVADTYDDEVINEVYKPYNNRFLSVVMKNDGLDKELVASVTNSIYANSKNQLGLEELKEVFKKPSLQFATFSITEKGYALKDMNGDLTKGAEHDVNSEPDTAVTNMGIITNLLLARYKAGKLPIAMVSTDNFSQNGKRLEEAVLLIANGWLKSGFVDQGFIDYLSNPEKVSFPWSMIDRITPNPSEKVSKQLLADGIEDAQIVHTDKHTNIAPFGNTEETHYLVIEDSFPNGRPKLEDAGVFMTDRETVNDADQMKVTACLNPLHTSLAIFGCLLGFHSIADEAVDDDLLKMIKNLGYGEDLPVVKDPKIINPKEFIDTLITKRLPNKNIPDTPQRIASDTSQKVGIRYGVTLQHYVDDQKLNPADLEFIPMIIAGWCRYLMATDDEGNTFTPSPDPLYDQLHEYVKDIKLGDEINVHEKLQLILSNKSIFGNDLYEIGIGEKVENYFSQMITKPGAVRETIHQTVEEKGKY
ncbi:mannitol dehydrogenase family protein [Limosilactobacillus sp. STM2_1]|uniref:Mannitol dehydrogenase family protein n=1 Tax=Limosilactobacillus rudii TaxID=2759755 RepID=A0A7W3UJH8_9LACO|nr:mannitol dehydrogenase family protein [Limosilactobacillus rudii]MBB1078684.1 mannitol dehydrogenase family protein [Limosilactobacillus rudii]MBB1096748.1 mannitol dehydrogenase family protein [Limosilactobacillus rudii]MCD7135580.1 mannitol dehydrogenase family protein [Limosilactobacillus rudii]